MMEDEEGMLSSCVFIDKDGKKLSREEAVAAPAGAVKLVKRNKTVERSANDFMLSSARLEAACMIILDKKRRVQKITEKDLTSFRSILREYLYIKDECLRKEGEMNTYILRDDPYMVMTMHRVAYLTRKACRCKTEWYGNMTHIGYFPDYDFSTGEYSDKMFSRLEKKLLKKLLIDPKVVLHMAYARMAIFGIPAILSGRDVFMQ